MNQKILTKAIEKAQDNGWNISPFIIKDNCLIFDNGETWHPNDYIFQHYFAKALWGIGCSDCGNPNAMTNPMGCGQPEWKLRLSQMVIADDPIQYLGDHL